jgi:hypothetical protein
MWMTIRWLSMSVIFRRVNFGTRQTSSVERHGQRALKGWAGRLDQSCKQSPSNDIWTTGCTISSMLRL